MILRLLVLALALPAAAAAQTPSGDARMKTIMRSKLSNAQAVLAAMVTANFTEIDRAALALSRISEMEISSWQNPARREYTEQAMLFLESVDGLRDAAKRRDMDAVGSEYFALVSTCIQCHKSVRDARVVRSAPR